MEKIDIPIRSLQEDEFSIVKYAKGLCSFIEKCDTPISISIQGEWGSGKTSLMNVIENELCNEDKGNEKFDSIWINTWELFLEDDLDKAVNKLINMIITQLENKFIDVKKRNSKENFTSDLKFFTKNLSKAVLSVSGIAEDLVENVFRDEYHSLKVLKEKFEHLLEEIVQNYENKVTNKGFIIFIDDLDRIEPKMAITLLEALKNIFDLRYCVFVIAIDYEVVARGLNLKYGNLKINNRDISRDYFDKMIQLPFVMPVEKYKIENVVEKRLLEMGYFKTKIEYKSVEDDVINIFNLCTNNNPRTIKRLLNMIQLNVIMDSENIEKNGVIYKVLELILVSMQLAYPSVYGLLLSNDDFKSWKKTILIDKNVEDITEELRERCKIDSEWKEVIYYLASKDYTVRKNYGKVSKLLELFDCYINKCKERNGFITEIFELIGMTSVNTNNNDVIFYDGNEYNKSSQTQVKQAVKLIDEVDLSECKKVLDVGCGSGLTTIKLMLKNPKIHIDAFDYSATQIKSAIENYKEIEKSVDGDINFYQMNALDLNEKEKYDLVFSNATLHWIIKSQEMYSLLYKSLKNGGKLAVHQGGDGSYKGLHGLVRQAIENLGYSKYFENWVFPVFYPTKKEMEDLLCSVGYKDINVISHETDGTEFDNLVENFKTASMIFYKERLKTDEQYNMLVEEYLKLSKEQKVDKYSHRLYIYAQK